MKPRTAARKPGGKPGKNEAKTSGRTTERTSGRYTPPVPTAVRRSPRWYPWLLLSLLVLGVLTIILNYIGTLPNSPTNWYTLVALLAIVAAALLATTYR